MTNIPTDLLRTLVAVVDLRSFTKAANSLGLTQPAVSAQIKRLQFLLGGDVFNRSVTGVELTSHSEMVVGHARRLLSINDQIVHLGGIAPRPELLIRVGTTSDTTALTSTFARFRERWPHVRFSICRDYCEALARQLRAGELDVVLGLSVTPPPGSFRSWPEEVVWVRGPRVSIEPDRPVPMVSHGEPCVFHRLAASELRSAGLSWDQVFIGPSTASLAGAVRTGLGVMAISRNLAEDFGLTIWEDAPLPKLPDIHRAVFVRDGGTREAYEELASDCADLLQGRATERPFVDEQPGRLTA